MPAEFGLRQTVWKGHHRWFLGETRGEVFARAAVMFGLDTASVEGRNKLLAADSTGVHAHPYSAGLVQICCTQGALANDLHAVEEPEDHVIGRSCGGRTVKVDAVTDQRQAPVAVWLTAGQAGDNPQLTAPAESRTRKQAG